MLVDSRNPKWLWIKLLGLCFALAGVVWAMRSLDQGPINALPPVVETK